MAVNGNLELENKQDAIMVITGLMEQFDVTTEDLEYY